MEQKWKSSKIRNHGELCLFESEFSKRGDQESICWRDIVNKDWSSVSLKMENSFSHSLIYCFTQRQLKFLEKLWWQKGVLSYWQCCALDQVSRGGATIQLQLLSVFISKYFVVQFKQDLKIVVHCAINRCVIEDKCVWLMCVCCTTCRCLRRGLWSRHHYLWILLVLLVVCIAIQTFVAHQAR